MLKHSSIARTTWPISLCSSKSSCRLLWTYNSTVIVFSSPITPPNHDRQCIMVCLCACVFFASGKWCIDIATAVGLWSLSDQRWQLHFARSKHMCISGPDDTILTQCVSHIQHTLSRTCTIDTQAYTNNGTLFHHTRLTSVRVNNG